MADTHPASIAENEQSHRQQRRRWLLLLGLMLLHGVYFGFPLLPFAPVGDFFPVLASLPPLFAVSYGFFGCTALRRRWQRSQAKQEFVPLPPVEESS